MNELIYNFTIPNKFIASFDLDNTLICTLSGKNFPNDNTDFKYKFKNIQTKLNELINKGYKIVIFTNQRKNYFKKTSIKDLLLKIKYLFPYADYFISIKEDIYRKPMIGMYQKFIALNGVPKNIFYVGNNAGRKKDNSYEDINFAYNAGIKFNTDTEFFLNEISLASPYLPIIPIKYNNICDMKHYNHGVVIIMQGLPSSGKTTFIKEYIKYNNLTNYLHLSNEKYTKFRLKKAFKKGLDQDNVIFIDDQNPTKKNRKEIIDLVNTDDYVILGFHIMTSMELSKSLSKQRYFISNTHQDYKEKKYNKIPTIVFNIYNKKYEPMTINEGFYKVYEFMPDIKLRYSFI